MTPEELNELRKSAEMVQRIGIQNAAICKHPYNGVNNASFALVNLPDLLAHIDAQAAQISFLDSRCNDLLEANEALKHEFMESNVLDLKRQIIELSDSAVREESKKDEQIEALKEKLVEQLAKYFVLQQAQCTFRTPIKGSMMSKCDKGVMCDWNVCPIKDEWEEQARQQLAEELKAAGVRWE